jgi:hypothetical protein
MLPNLATFPVFIFFSFSDLKPSLRLFTLYPLLQVIYPLIILNFSFFIQSSTFLLKVSLLTSFFSSRKAAQWFHPQEYLKHEKHKIMQDEHRFKLYIY